MKKFVLILVLLLCSLQNINAANKAITKKKTQELQYSTVPFNESIEKLPINFIGHDLVRINEKIVLPKPKGEFERSEEYDARLERWKQSPIIGKISPKDTMAFMVSESMTNALSVKYDADTEVLTVGLSFEYPSFESKSETSWLEMFYNSKNLGSQNGVTRMGIKFRYNNWLGLSTGLVVKKTDEDRYNIKRNDIVITEKFSREVIQKIKPFLGVLVIGTLEEPYNMVYISNNTASLDDPNDWTTYYKGLYFNIKSIWVINRLTGEIVAKSDLQISN